MKLQGSKEGRENHLQRTASCSWRILQGLHHTALLPDKKQDAFAEGQSLVLPDRSRRLGSSFSGGGGWGWGGCHFPGPALEPLHLPSSCASSTPCSTSASLCTPRPETGSSDPPVPQQPLGSTLVLIPLHRQPSLPTYLLFLFWGHMVGGCFDVLQSFCVASTFLL